MNNRCVKRRIFEFDRSAEHNTASKALLESCEEVFEIPHKVLLESAMEKLGRPIDEISPLTINHTSANIQNEVNFMRSIGTLELRSVLAFIDSEIESIGSQVKNFEQLVDLFLAILSNEELLKIINVVQEIRHPSFLEVDDVLLDAAWKLAEIYRGKSNNRINRNLDGPDSKNSYLTSKDIQPTIEHMVFEQLGEKFKLQFLAKKLKQLAIKDALKAEQVLLDLEQRGILFYSSKTGAAYREQVSSILTELAKSNSKTAALILRNYSLRRILFSAGPINSSLKLKSIATAHPESAALIEKDEFLRKKMLNEFQIQQPVKTKEILSKILDPSDLSSMVHVKKGEESHVSPTAARQVTELHESCSDNSVKNTDDEWEIVNVNSEMDPYEIFNVNNILDEDKEDDDDFENARKMSY